MNYLYEKVDEHIQWLINFMNEEYPNDYELVIDSNSGTIRSTLQAQIFLRNDLLNPEGFRKATEKPMNKFAEKLAEVAKEHYKNETNTAYEDFLKAIDSEPFAKMREIKEGFGNSNNTLCESWESHEDYAICNSTKERKICRCDGDIRECDYL